MTNNIKTSKIRFPHKGFFFSIILVFSLYQVSATFVEKWFDKREARDNLKSEKQKVVEKMTIKKNQLKGVPDVIDGGESPLLLEVKSIENIFSESAESLLSTQKFNPIALNDIQTLFLKKEETKSLISEDVRKFDAGVMKIVNLYALKSVEQHPETRKENLKFIKNLILVHKKEVMRVYSISDLIYKDVYPVFSEISFSSEKLLENTFLVEYKLKKSKNDYLLTIGGEALRAVYVPLNYGGDMPVLATRNVIELNQYINNITKEVPEEK